MSSSTNPLDGLDRGNPVIPTDVGAQEAGAPGKSAAAGRNTLNGWFWPIK